MKIAFIGTGPSSLSAIEELIKKKQFEIFIFDIGKKLPRQKIKLQNLLKKKDIRQWTEKEFSEITHNSFSKNNLIPQKNIFGSKYPYKNDQQLIQNNVNIYSSCAKGGFFNVWGAAALPISDNDIKDWPINNNHLKKYYAKIMKSMPYSLQNDGLNKLFSPIIKNPKSIKIPEQSRNLIKKLNNLKSKKIFCGQSRLSIYTEGKNKCNYCGTCLTGCVYNSIFNLNSKLDKIINNKNVHYFENVELVRYEEKVGKVKLHFKKPIKNLALFDKLFIGAGAVSTAKIVINSNKSINDVILSDSQKFIIPIFNFEKMKENILQINALCSIFFDYIFSTGNIIHTQISNYNNLIDRMISPKIRPFLSFFTQRLMIGWSGLNSKDSHKIHIYKKDGNFFATKIKNKKTTYHIFKYSFLFFLNILKTGNISSPIPIIAKCGGGSHLGSSFPMSDNPKKVTDTDLLGRLKNHKNTHIIDSSVLPNIPSTTIALLTMANAKRIINDIFK